MPIGRADGRPRLAAAAVCGIGLAVGLIATLGGIDWVLAQTNPFGGPRPPSAAPSAAPEGVVGWIIAKQNEYYRQFSGLIRAAKTDGSAVWALLGVSFFYGVFHAAGPGHGKAVISSYVVANEETWRRGVILSFASAMAQAIVAVAIVGIALLLFNASRAAICNADFYIEIASYGLIAAIGARLTWVKGRGLIAAVLAPTPTPAHSHAGHGDAFRAHDHGHSHSHSHHSGPDQHHGHHHHGHGDHSGHSHGPEPGDLAGPGGWQRGLSAVIAVGLRPCSGAILVLVFAVAQELFWAGVAATFVMGLGTAMTVAIIATMAIAAKDIALRLSGGGSGRGTLVLRLIETGAAVIVLVFGLALLAGYLSIERMTVAC